MTEPEWDGINTQVGLPTGDFRERHLADDVAPGGPWASHGHEVPGVTVAGSGRPPVARCGGPRICSKCATEAFALLAEKERTDDR